MVLFAMSNKTFPNRNIPISDPIHRFAKQDLISPKCPDRIDDKQLYEVDVALRVDGFVGGIRR